MNAQSKISDLLSWMGMPNATSSPALASGPMRSDLLEWQTPSPSGPVPARVNLSARQANNMGLLTSGTFGLTSTGLSISAALTESLVNKLKEKLELRGSILFNLTWKELVTPARRRLFLLRASAHRKCDIELGGWQTPRARGDARGQRWKNGKARNLEDQARMYGLMRGLTVSEVAAMNLSPTFSRRLMGIPPEWDDCAPMAIQFVRKSRQNSSKLRSLLNLD